MRITNAYIMESSQTNGKDPKLNSMRIHNKQELSAKTNICRSIIQLINYLLEQLYKESRMKKFQCAATILQTE